MNDSIIEFPIPPGPTQLKLEEQDIPREYRLAALEAVIFASETPPTLKQLSAALGLREDLVKEDLDILRQSYRGEDRGVEIRPVGGGYRMFTKVEHHGAVRAFARSLKPRVTLSAAALETLAIIAYRQPITIPEIGAIRGVSNPGGVIQTLLGHKLIAMAGRKKVIGRPMRYKTTNAFLVHFGLNDLTELPTMKEMQDLGLAARDEDLPDADKKATAAGDGAQSSSATEPDTGAGS